jgi:hypothetical protein
LVDDLWKDEPHQTETSVPEPGSSSFAPQRGSSSQARSSGPYPSNVHGLGRGDSGPIRLVESIEWDSGEIAACLINWEDLDHSEFQRPLIQQGTDGETFDLDNAESVFFNGDLYLVRKRNDELSLKSLTPKELEQFLGVGGSRDKEWRSIVDSGAVTVLTLKESRRIRLERPDRIISSRMVDRWKTTDDKGTIAKSRWCAHGFKDPDIEFLNRSSPTPQTSSIYCGMQLFATRKWKASLGDIKVAFNQSDKTTRRDPLLLSAA